MATTINQQQQKAEPENKVRTLVEQKNFQEAVARVLPAHLTPDRFIRIAVAALTRTPRLQECDPDTVLQCLIQLSQYGLEPDGRNAHLIPFRNKRGSYDCTLIIDYKGLASLAKRSGQVSYVHADAVCENDAFEYNKGVVVKHEIDFKKDRGKPYAYYAMVRFKDGTEQADCMTRVEVEKIRSRSRAANDGPWVTDFDEMGKKTVFRRLSKWLELSPEFRDAVESDADSLEDLRFENAIPIERPKIGRLKARTVTVEPEEPTEPQAEKPKAEPPAKSESQKKLKAIPSEPEPEPPQRELGENEKQMIARLNMMNRTKEQLVQVAIQFESLQPNEGWDDIGENGFATLLYAPNWKEVEKELQKL